MSPPAVQLNLFGSPTLTAVGRTSALPFERRTQLAVLLALRREWVPRAELASMLWPEVDGKRAFANLRKTLFRLPAFAWARGLEQRDAALRFEVATDVAAFESALREGQPGAALELYGGDLLTGFDDGQTEAWTRWVSFERERLRAAWRSTALARLADPAVEPSQALALSARLLEADPLDEAALRHRMDALARDGQSGAARQAYRQFVERLADDLGLEPGTELRALHDKLSGTLRPVEIVRPHGAAADDGFVGRSVEMKRIGDLLALRECRLLCLIGPGGVGKTRLAQRAQQALGERFADGALFIALEDVDTAEQFGRRLAQEAGVKGSGGGRDALTRAIATWHEQELLLVLDNFEQLAEHAPLLDRLLRECPRAKIVVTSRVRVAVAGAWSVPVEGLPCPDPEDDDRAEAFDAVRLFIKAAQRVEPAFAAASERAAIVDICRQVEGLPLAIELAAAWVRMLSCDAIAAELRQGTELLRASDAAYPARHASIEAVFEHSWRRSSQAEREVLSRLSVFRGGFTFEAARAVTGAVLPVLGALVDRSLLAKDGTRMQLHPLVQQLAALRLSEAERAATAATHATYYLHWVAKLHSALEVAEGSALQAIDTEFENCRRAWGVCTETGPSDSLRAAARVLLNYFDYRGRLEEGLAWLRQTIESPLCRDDDALRARFLSQASRLQFRTGRYDAAQASASEALKINLRVRDRETRRQALTVLGSSALQKGRLPEARRRYLQALALASPEARAHNTAATLDNLAMVEKRLGNYDESLRLSNESLAQHRRLVDHAGVALCLNNLATTYLLRGEYDTARAHLLEALAISEREGEMMARTYVLSTLSEVSMKTGDLAAARRYAERALELTEQTGNRGVGTSMQLHLARVAVAQADLPLARKTLATGTAMAIALGAPALHAAAIQTLAALFDAQQERHAARQVLAFAAGHPSTTIVDRDQLRVELAQITRADDRDPAWPGMPLDELLNRVVAEAALEHQPLLTLLRGAMTAPD